MNALAKLLNRLGDDSKALQALNKAAAKFDDAANEFESSPSADQAKVVKKLGSLLEDALDDAEKEINPQRNKEGAKTIAEIRKQMKDCLGTLEEKLKEAEAEQVDEEKGEEDLASNESKVASVERTRMLLKKLDAEGMAFALALDPGKYNEPVLSLWPRKDPKSLGGLLKKTLKAKKCTYGLAKANTEGLLLTDQAGAVSGLVRHVKAYLTANKPMPFTKAKVLNAKGEDITQSSDKKEAAELQSEIKEAAGELATLAKVPDPRKTLVNARKALDEVVKAGGDNAAEAGKFIARMSALEKDLQKACGEAKKRLSEALRSGPESTIDPYSEVKKAGEPLGELQTLAEEALTWTEHAAKTGKRSTLSTDQRLAELEKAKKDISTWLKEGKAWQQEALPALSRVQENGDPEQKKAAETLRSKFNDAFKALIATAQNFAKRAKDSNTGNILETFMPIMKCHDSAFDLRRDVGLYNRQSVKLAGSVVYPE